jgi:hypothetical protein
MRGANTIEIRLSRGADGALSINGWPSADALRPRRRS